MNISHLLRAATGTSSFATSRRAGPLHSVGAALLVASALLAACGDDTTTGAGGSGSSSGASPSSVASSSSAGATGTDHAASTADGVGGGEPGGGGAGGDGSGGEGTTTTATGGAGQGGATVGEGGAGSGSGGDGGDEGGAGGEGGAGNGGGGEGGSSKECLEISSNGLALLTAFDGAAYYQGPSTVGFDGPDPDVVELDLLSDDLTGVIDLGFAAGQPPSVCEAGLWVYADYVDQTTQRIFFVDSGTLDLGESHNPYIEGTIVDATLVEVEIDFDAGDFVPVEGGACLHIDELAFDVEPRGAQ